MTFQEVLTYLRDNPTCKFDSFQAEMLFQDLQSFKYWILDYDIEEVRIQCAKKILTATDWQLVYFEDNTHAYEHTGDGIWRTLDRGIYD